MRMAARLEAMGLEKYRGLTRKSGRRHVWTGKIRCDQASLDAPRTWVKPRRIFVNSMSDLFHEKVPAEFVHRVLDRDGGNIKAHVSNIDEAPRSHARGYYRSDPCRCCLTFGLGTSVEDNRVLDRIDTLRRVPAAVRFVSFEPLIGSVAQANLSGIQWAIVGGESGPRARPMRPEWVDEIESLCQSVGTKFFFKQWGGQNKKVTGRRYRGRLVGRHASFKNVICDPRCQSDGWSIWV